MWLPIASDVVLCSAGGRADEWLFNLPDAGVRVINGTIAAQSTVIASASRDLVTSFSRRYRR